MTWQVIVIEYKLSFFFFFNTKIIANISDETKMKVVTLKGEDGLMGESQVAENFQKQCSNHPKDFATIGSVFKCK